MTAARDPTMPPQGFAEKLYRILGGLARRGVVATPAEALELVHEFVSRGHGAGIEKAYRPERGPLEPYAAKAFVRFATRELGRSRRLRTLQLDEALLAVAATDDAAPDREEFAAAVDGLPPPERALLRETLEAPSFSLAALARRRGTTSYRLRRRLLDALAKVVVRMRPPAHVSSDDWAVAELVWRDRLGAAEVARRLGLSVPQVKTAQARMLRAVGRGLDAVGFRRGTKMTDSQPQPAPGRPFLDALRRPHDRAALDALVAHADEVRAALDADDALVDEADVLAETCPDDWRAAVFVALAGPAEAAGDGAEVEWPYRDELEHVGEAFTHALVPGLPSALASFAAFDAVEACVSEMQAAAAEHPSTLAAELPADVGARLRRVGLTPMSFLHGADAVADLLERYLDDGAVPVAPADGAVEVRIDLTPAGFAVPGIVTSDDFTTEIALCADVPAATAQALHQWLRQAAPYKPWLLVGFEARSSDADACVLAVTPRPAQRNLLHEWQSVEGPAAADVAADDQGSQVAEPASAGFARRPAARKVPRRLVAFLQEGGGRIYGHTNPALARFRVTPAAEAEVSAFLRNLVTSPLPALGHRGSYGGGHDTVRIEVPAERPDLRPFAADLDVREMAFGPSGRLHGRFELPPDLAQRLPHLDTGYALIRIDDGSKPRALLAAPIETRPEPDGRVDLWLECEVPFRGTPRRRLPAHQVTLFLFDGEDALGA